MDEKEELALWIDTVQNDEEWKLRLEEIWKNYESDKEMDPLKADAVLKTILKGTKKQLQPMKIVNQYYRRWWIAAASILLIAASTVYFLRKQTVTKTLLTTSNITKRVDDIFPGGNKAILTLTNGAKVMLDSMKNGSRTQQGNTKVIKLGSGQLAYEAFSGPSKGGKREISYNTITTPRGGQYQVILPDGSKVWLNAASSLHFPTAFSGKERKVEVSGEAYFEIAKNASTPFTVHISSSHGQDGGTVEVLGTHFNINAYEDESSIKTTLLEGAVKIFKDNETMILSPGEQAAVNKNGEIKLVKNTDVDEAVAWKNGLFEFDGNDIQSVMRQISRWYDVDVKYKSTTSAHFLGTISRNVNASEVLKMLEMTGEVHFRIEGKSITVLP